MMGLSGRAPGSGAALLSFGVGVALSGDSASRSRRRGGALAVGDAVQAAWFKSRGAQAECPGDVVI
jgi:hypothetical protein